MRFLLTISAAQQRSVCAAGIAHVVIVAEQLGTGPFNRGALLNFAFLAGQPGIPTVAIVDVDMLPLPGVNFSDVGWDVA